MRNKALFVNRIRQYLDGAANTESPRGGFLMGKVANGTTSKAGRPPTQVDERAQLARRQLIRSAIRKKKWDVDRLHSEAVKKYGKAAMSLVSFQRLLTKRAPAGLSETVSQAFELLDITEDAVTERTVRNDAAVVASVLPDGSKEIMPHIKKAAQATAEEVADMSRQLMETRHGSFHAFLTLWLLGEK